jgi:hypothetical protein
MATCPHGHCCWWPQRLSRGQGVRFCGTGQGESVISADSQIVKDWSILLSLLTHYSFSLFQIWQLGHGDYSASRTKVFRMVNTLGVNNEAKQTIQVLQAELNETKERLHTVEELKGQTAHYLYCS